MGVGGGGKTDLVKIGSWRSKKVEGESDCSTNQVAGSAGRLFSTSPIPAVQTSVSSAVEASQYSWASPQRAVAQRGSNLLSSPTPTPTHASFK